MKPMNKKARRLLFWGYFWRYGIIALTILLPAISFMILSYIGVLKEYAYIVLFSFTIPFIIMGADYILAAIFKWPHILLVNQSANHRKMNPYDLNWYDFSVKEFIVIGVILLVAGIGLSIIFLYKLL